ncbi:hypothetical protein BJ742DRAFT_817396 [Cladochytrium replicatum]|nr:hypothetical protein BJ742DRAFT_817396 [Cladochytrium replicatum]
MRSSAILRAAAQSSTKSPWGTMDFSGVNWRQGGGALPFSVRKRGRFLTVFAILGVVGLGLPFFAVELRLAPARAARRAAASEN